MNDNCPYVLDSCIWIGIEKKKPHVCKKVFPLIEENQVCVVDLIVAEVLRGVKSEKDFKELKETFLNFDQIAASWEKVADLAFKIKKMGFTPPLTDIYIASSVYENKKILITEDKDFLEIKKVLPFQLEMI